jgi:2-polyprenyl-3-methyl-5-hydroxy-6-metoxy-1,4-benzoquinol methylase
VEANPEAVDELQRKLLTEFQHAIEGLRLQRIERVRPQHVADCAQKNCIDIQCRYDILTSKVTKSNERVEGTQHARPTLRDPR